MKTKYYIYFNRRKIGFTYFESADPPMGVVFGSIIFEGIELPYKFLRNYCMENDIELQEDDPEHEILFTGSIKGIRIVSEDETKIKGKAAIISGFIDEEYHIEVIGIPYPLYEEVFFDHLKAYKDKYST